MTRVTLDELGLPAGRELDALIAEKVMGYERSPEIKPYGFGDAWLKHYSTDIAAAWEVVDKMYVHSLRRVVNPEPDKPALWQVHIYADSTLCGIAETVPLAICRAALLALEVLSNPPA